MLLFCWSASLCPFLTILLLKNLRQYSYPRTAPPGHTTHSHKLQRKRSCRSEQVAHHLFLILTRTNNCGFVTMQAKHNAQRGWLVHSSYYLFPPHIAASTGTTSQEGEVKESRNNLSVWVMNVWGTNEYERCLHEWLGLTVIQNKLGGCSPDDRRSASVVDSQDVYGDAET